MSRGWLEFCKIDFQVNTDQDETTTEDNLAITRPVPTALIQLSDQQPFAGGCKRDCYVHPHQPDQIIKVIPEYKSIHVLHSKKLWIRRILQTPESMDANRGEHEKFEKLTRKFGNLRKAFPYLVEYFGKVQTDLGEGLAFKAIKDFDGAMSKTIEAANETGNYLKPQLLEAVNAMAAARNDGTIYHDVGKHNIVIQLLSPDHQQYKLWIIDGINNRALLPIAEYSTIYANIRKAKKIWQLKQFIQGNFKSS